MKREERHYSIAELALMTRLSTKTIRNYLKMGLLKGEKIDGAWRFSENEIGEFFQERFVKGALEIKRNGQVLDFLNGMQVKNKACLVFDREFVTQDELEVYITKFIEEVNRMNSQGKEEGLDFSFWKDEQTNLARLTLIGNPLYLKELMNRFF